MKTSDWPFRLLGRRNARRSKLNNVMTLLVKKSHPLDTRPFSTPMLTLTHQLSSGRSTALTRNSCVLPPTCCILRLLPKNEAFRSITGAITDPSELENAQMKLFYITQSESFPTETRNLRKNSPFSSSSKIPFHRTTRITSGNR